MEKNECKLFIAEGLESHEYPIPDDSNPNITILYNPYTQSRRIIHIPYSQPTLSHDHPRIGTFPLRGKVLNPKINSPPRGRKVTYDDFSSN
jgi:hypothetical protein